MLRLSRSSAAEEERAGLQQKVAPCSDGVFDVTLVSVSRQAAAEKLTWKDRLAGYVVNVSSILFMVRRRHAAHAAPPLRRSLPPCLLLLPPSSG